MKTETHKATLYLVSSIIIMIFLVAAFNSDQVDSLEPGVCDQEGKILQRGTNNWSCVDLTTGSGGNPFDQWLNTTDDVNFNTVDVTEEVIVRDSAALTDYTNITADNSNGSKIQFYDRNTPDMAIKLKGNIFSLQAPLGGTSQICDSNTFHCGTIAQFLSSPLIGDNIYLYRLGTTMYLNETKLNQTIDARASGGGGNPFDQWVNTTSNTTIDNNNQSYFSYDLAHQITNTGHANSIQTYGGCKYEGTTNEILCTFGSGFWGEAQTLDVGGVANNIALGLFGAVANTITVNGYANMLGGLVDAGDTNISGHANLMWGLGNFDVDESSNGNIGTGSEHEFIDATGAGAFGALHDIKSDYCFAFGAQNTCAGVYGTALGYNNKLYGATGVTIGRLNFLGDGAIYSGTIGLGNNNTGRESYSFGRNVETHEDYVVAIGNGLTNAGTPNDDIVINYTHININKTWNEAYGITGLHNNPHVEMWNTTENGYTLSIASLNVWYNITGLNFGEYTDFTGSGNRVLADYDGTYKVDWSMSFSGTGGSTHAVSLLINGQEHPPCRSYRKLGTAGDVGNMGGTCLITLSAGDNVTGAVKDINAPAQDIDIWSVNANIVRVNE